MSKISRVLLHIVAVFLTVCSGFSSEDIEPVPPAGYLPKSSYTDRLNETFHQDFHGCVHYYERRTEIQAAIDTWAAYDIWFEDQIVRNVLLKMERLGLQALRTEQVDQLRDYLNPGRGTAREPGEIIRWYAVTDARHFIKFRLRTMSDREISLGWVSSRYTTRVTADLDMGTWEYLGPVRPETSTTAADLAMERNLQGEARRK